MNVRQLEVFRAVMDEGSATAAARSLNLSQPSVSRHLAQLESALGLDLFVRDRGRLVATAQAVALHGEVVQAFEGLDRLFNLARTIRARPGGLLRIGCPYSLADGLIPRVAERFGAAHPEVRISVEQGRYPAIVAMVAARQVDLGLAKGEIDHPGVTTRPLARCVSVAAVPPGHRLVGKGRLSLADLAPEPLVMLGRDRPSRSRLEMLFRRNGLVPRVRIETHSVGAACGFVARGLGIALVPRLFAEQFADRGIALCEIEPRIDHEFRVVLPAPMPPSALVERFIERLREEIGTQEEVA